jgi:hypothetical protein
MFVYPRSAQNRSKLMSRLADFRLNIQPTDLMKRYETLWTQIIQFFQPLAEWVPNLLKSIDKVSEIKIKRCSGIPLRTLRLLLGVDPIRPIDILNARY